MAYNEEIAKRVRDLISIHGERITEKKMFGGLTFLYKGKMAVGVVKDDLAVRVVDKKYHDYISKPFVRPMDFTGKPMKEFLYVESDAFKSELQLSEWIDLGIEHAESKL